MFNTGIGFFELIGGILYGIVHNLILFYPITLSVIGMFFFFIGQKINKKQEGT